MHKVIPAALSLQTLSAKKKKVVTFGSGGKGILNGITVIK